MRVSRFTTFVLCLLGLFLSAATHGSAEPLTFSAMGCGPYNEAAEIALPHFMKRENAETKKSDFLVHLGDICKGTDARDGKLNEETYASIGRILTESSKIPAYVVPGDNEWNDRPDPDVGWQLWSKHLLHIDRKFEKPWKTENQKERTENFAFVQKGVLVIGINLVGGRVHSKEEWAGRFAHNLEWIRSQFEKHKENVRAAVILGQANPIGFGKKANEVNEKFEGFVLGFGPIAASFKKPILFLHADGHKWFVDKPWTKAPNVTRAQVDLIAPQFPPLRVTVREKVDEKGEIFAFDRRLETKGSVK